jgi:DNA polymerase III delta' subunit
MSFQKISNQPDVVAALRSALEKERLPHALLFQGPAGSSQRETAAELAKALFCVSKKGPESCDACYHCRQIDRNSHPDFLILEPEKDARDIKVEAIRNLMTRASLKPFNANAKVFVIDPADRMNDVSQNAFLKTLEEPLGRTFFLLISAAPDGLLPTIRSRVQILNFVPVTKGDEDQSVPSPLKKTVLEYVFYHAHEPLKAPDLSRLSREELARVLDTLIEAHRDLLLLKVDAGEILRADENLFEKERLAKTFNEEELEERIEFFGEIKEKLNVNLNVKLVLSCLWDTLA